MVDERDRLRRIRQLEAEQATALAKAEAEAKVKATEDAKYVRDPKTGLSPAQLEARGLVKEAAQAAADVGIEGKVVTPKGSAGKFIEKPEAPPADANFRYDYQWVGASTGTNIGSYKLVKYPKVVTTDSTDTTGYKVVNGILLFNGQPFSGTYNGQTYENGKVKTTDSTDTTGYKVVNGILLFNGQPFSGTYEGKTYENGKVKVVTDGSNNVPTGLDAETLALIKSLQAQIANLTTGNAATAAATKAAEKLAERQSAFDVLRAEMDALGLAALVEPLRGLIQKDVSPSEFAVELRQSEAYKNRFIANEGRLKKGLRVLTPGEYLRVEDAYRQTLRTYGLKQFDNDQYVRQFIENDISAAELSDRVSTAVQRVQNADPAIGRTLRDYYGIGQTDLVAYVLDPNQQLQKIQRQVAAAEIGVAARKQGLEAGVTVAEQLATQGITEAQAQKGYATIADILPTSEKLSQIYGTTLEGYGQAEAEQEVFNTLASAQRKRQRLVGREIAEFSGQSGLGRGSLGTATGGQY